MLSEQINPDHYTRCKETLGVEVVDILDYFFGTDPHLWNAGKYLLRVGHKPGQDRVTELGKAAWYIERAKEKNG